MTQQTQEREQTKDSDQKGQQQGQQREQHSANELARHEFAIANHKIQRLIRIMRIEEETNKVREDRDQNQGGQTKIENQGK